MPQHVIAIHIHSPADIKNRREKNVILDQTLSRFLDHLILKRTISFFFNDYYSFLCAFHIKCIICTFDCIVFSGISLVEKLLTNHELMIKSWRLDRETNDKQVRDHLVHMRRVFMKRSIVYCRKRNVEVLLETVCRHKTYSDCC